MTPNGSKTLFSNVFRFILGLRDIVRLLYWFWFDTCRRLLAYPKGNGYGINKSLSLLLDVADSESLPDGWKRHVKYRLTVVNQKSEKLSKQKGDSFYICLTMFPRRTKVKCLCCSEILCTSCAMLALTKAVSMLIMTL